jgi:hypothetical protein
MREQRGRGVGAAGGELRRQKENRENEKRTAAEHAGAWSPWNGDGEGWGAATRGQNPVPRREFVRQHERQEKGKGDYSHCGRRTGQRSTSTGWCRATGSNNMKDRATMQSKSTMMRRTHQAQMAENTHPVRSNGRGHTESAQMAE